MYYFEVQKLGKWRARTQDGKPRMRARDGVERLLTNEGEQAPIRDIIEVPPDWTGRDLDELQSRKAEMRALEQKRRRAAEAA